MVQYIYKQAFQLNQGGLAAAASRGAVPHHRRLLGAAVPAPARARGDDERRRATADADSAIAEPRRFAASRTLDRVGLVVTLATLVARGDRLGLPALLGARHDLQARGRGRAGRACSSGREHLTFDNYTHVLFDTKIGIWYINSLITSVAVTVIVVVMAAGAGYAISQLEFPGRRAALVDDPGELHGADPGADRQPFHPDEPVPADQHAGRRRRRRS